MTVALKKADLNNISSQLEDALKSINYIPQKKKVLIKPNLVYACDVESGIITHPKVVEAIIEYLKKFNCEIAIGEGSGVGHNTMEVFKKTGYQEIAKKHNVALLDLNECERKEYTWKYGKIKLPKLLEEYEYINVPTLKTHTITTVTLGTKNQKGLLDYNTKKLFHHIGVDESVLELANIIKPSLTVINGLFCLEGNSVSIIKKSKKLNIIIAGKNMFEVDNIGLKVMDINPEEIKHFPIIKDIEIIGEDIEKVKSKFSESQKVRKILNIEFQLNGCSGCSVNTEQAIRALAKKPFLLSKFLYYALFKKVTFVSGCKLKKDIEPNSKVIYIGNCTKLLSNGKYLEGCPPSPKQILKAIKNLH